MQIDLRQMSYPTLWEIPIEKSLIDKQSITLQTLILRKMTGTIKDRLLENDNEKQMKTNLLISIQKLKMVKNLIRKSKMFVTSLD